MALSVREAQTPAVSVRGRNGVFDVPYGLYFDIDNNDQYILFRGNHPSNKPDYKYESGNNNDVAVETITINENFQIKKLCYGDTSSNEYCHDHPSKGFTELVIMFKLSLIHI